MTYSISHRQMGVTRSDVAGLVRHNFRDVDLWDEKKDEVSHSNERIVSERTGHNESFIFRSGVPVEMETTDEVLDELDRRLANVGGTRVDKDGTKKRVAVRKDAKVVREIILQLDPEFTRSSAHLVVDGVGKPGASEHRNNVEDLMWKMVDFYGDVYGRENLLAASLHYDETSPHMHLMVTPIDDEGRVRQESFIKSGRGRAGGMSKNDRSLRKFIKKFGFDVDEKPRGAGRGHLTVEQYAAWQQRQQDVKEKEVELEDRAAELVSRERDLAARESYVKSLESGLADEAAEIDRRERVIDRRESALVDRERVIEDRQDEVDRNSVRVRVELERAAQARSTFEEAKKVFSSTNDVMAAYNSELKAHTRVLKPGVRPKVDQASERLQEGAKAYRMAMKHLKPAIEDADDVLEML